jgi:hypothetical protein
MAKVCALCALGFLLWVFFGFGGLFFRLLRVVVIGGRPEGGEGTAGTPGSITYAEVTTERRRECEKCRLGAGETKIRCERMSGDLCDLVLPVSRMRQVVDATMRA